MSNTNQKPVNPYNYGIELMRIVSMLMVVTLHVLGQGGVLPNCLEGSIQYHVAWSIEIVCYCAVNCYALISGFVMVDGEFRYGKIVPLWLQAVFYSLGITIVFLIVAPQQIGLFNIVSGVFPVLTLQWWYFTAYVGMYFLIPFLNFLINKLKKKELIMLATTLIVLFSIIGTLAKPVGGDVFGTDGGYSLLWLSVLYVLGAIFKKFEPEIQDILKQYKHCKAWVALVGMVFILITILFHNVAVYIPGEVIGRDILQNILIDYRSPTVLGFAICLLLLFSNIKIHNRRFKDFLKCVGKLSFGVYLIHTHLLIWSTIMKDRFVSFAKMPVYQMVPCIIGTVIGIFVICIMIEAVRNKLFDLLRIRERVLKCVKW